MNNILCTIATIMLMFFMLGNRKVCLHLLFFKQIKVFRDAEKNKVSIWDLFCFIIFPVCLAYVIVYEKDMYIDKTLSEILTTVFSLIFTVLFGFAAIILGKIDSKNEIEKRVVQETFISIMSATVLSLFSVVCSIIVLKMNEDWTIKLISTIVYSVSFMTVMLLLLVSKRTFLIYNDSMK